MANSQRDLADFDSDPDFDVETPMTQGGMTITKQNGHRHPLNLSTMGILLAALSILLSSGHGVFADTSHSPPSALEPVMPLSSVHALVMPGVDTQRLVAEDLERERLGMVPRYATPLPVDRNPETSGTWEALKDGRLLWRLHILSPGATSLNFAFSPYVMPMGGELHIHSPDHAESLGPYTDRDNEDHGELWTPDLQGDEAVIELAIPEPMLDYLALRLAKVNHGYREKGWNEGLKSGTCNIDTVCSEGDGWRDEIRSTAKIVVSGIFLCTGFMVNNTARDLMPYFLTAYHCDVTEANAPSLVVYWNYETRPCGGRPNGSTTDTQSGSSLVASAPLSDFTLVRLDDDPSPAFDVHWAGWDNSPGDFVGAVTIHHPHGDEKRISFEDDPLTTTSYLKDTSPGDGTHIRVADWDTGTTEGGSSGSALWNLDHRVIGQLHGGWAACGNDLPDWYGRFSVSWDTGVTPGSRLRDWLDPQGTGTATLDGMDACPRPGVDFTIEPNPALLGEEVTFTSNVSSGQPPYSYEWDLDGDGLTDCAASRCTRTYDTSHDGNVRLTVFDSSPCPASVSHHIALEAMPPTLISPYFALTTDAPALFSWTGGYYEHFYFHGIFPYDTAWGPIYYPAGFATDLTAFTIPTQWWEGIAPGRPCFWAVYGYDPAGGSTGRSDVGLFWKSGR